MAALNVLEPRHVFGAKGDVRANVHYLDETIVLYAAGNQIVLHHVESNTQRFVPGAPDAEGITALALSPNRKFLAIAERGEKATISVLDLATHAKRRKVLSSAEVNAKEYVSLSFSPDGKSIVACGGGPEWNVVVFRWEKLRCVGVVPARAPNAPVAPVREILWNPSEPSTASLVGVGSFRIFKMTETGARPMPSALGKRNAGAFTAHCWLPTEATGATGTGTESNPGNNNTRNKESERGAAGQTGDGKERKEKESGQKEKTHDDHKKKDGKGADGDKQSGTQVCVVADDAGELLIVENGEVRAVLPSPGLHSGIDVVVAHGTKGFICGGEHGKIYMYEKTDDQQMFKLVKTFSVPIFSESGPDGRNESRSTQASEGHHVGGAAARIKSLTLSPSEETLVCGLQNNQIYVVDLVDADILKEEEMQFEMLSSAFHEEGICGIDACVKKPLVATCSSDKTVRIWNYLDMSCELAKEFPEEALSVSFHPSGLHVLVGFTDKLRLCNLLLDDIRPYKEFPIKNCAECCFSNGGHLFAAVNGSVVMVYDAYTCENIGNFRGHGGRVTSVSWGLDDQTIVSAGVDGAVYEWTPKTFARNKENVKKGTEYLCAVQSVDGENAYAVGFDAVTKTSVLREFDMTHQLVREIDTEVLLTQIAMPRSAKTGALFAASAGGSVRTYRFPLTGEFQTLDCHGASISQIVLSHDDSTLFVASNDGCVSVFDVKDKDGASLRGRGKDAFSEEVLVTKADMEETLSKTSALEMHVAELTLENEQELRAHTTNMNLKIKDLTEKFTAELEGDKAQFETLAQSKNEQELQFETDLKSAEDVASSQAADTEQGYSRKMLAEVERYQALVCERDLLNEKWDEQNAALAERHERVVQELTEEFAGKLREEVRLREKMRRKLDLGTRESDTVIDQMEEDMDLEVLEIKQKYELRLAEARDVGLRLKGENGIMKKKFNQLQKDIHEQKETILGLGDDKKQLRQTIGDLKKDLTGLRKELWDRDDTIGDKERRIYDLKKKTQELEKFKFVLDYKIKQLKKQIEPRELDVADMKTTIKQMDHELEKYHKSNAYLELSITDLKHKLVGVQKDEVKQRELVTLHKSQIKSFQADLHETSRQTLYPKKLAASVNALYQKHVMSGSVVDNGLDEDVQKEFQRQRLFLEKTIENLKRKLAKDVEGHRSDVARVLGENVVLLKEVNELRRESKLAKQRQKAQLVTSAGNHGGAHRSQLGVGFSEENPGDPAVSLTPGSKVPREIDFSVDVARELEQLRVSLAEARLEIQIKDAQVRELEKSAGAGRTGATGGDVQDRANDPDLEAAVSAMAMRQAENEEKAATNIQAMHRGNAARREVDAMRQEAQAEEPPPLDKEDSLGAM